MIAACCVSKFRQFYMLHCLYKYLQWTFTLILGPVWENKVRSCLDFFQAYISTSSKPFRDMTDKASFFNTENPDSTVHHLACDGGRICIENTQLHGLLCEYNLNDKRNEFIEGDSDPRVIDLQYFKISPFVSISGAKVSINIMYSNSTAFIAYFIKCQFLSKPLVKALGVHP